MRPIHAVGRIAWLVLGLMAVALAGIGVALPLLPTTPFLLVAVFAFARSSRRLERWLREHRLFGKLISDWEKYGAIDRRSKTLAIASMAIVILISIVLDVSTRVLIIQAIVLCLSATFIATRPLPPQA